MTRKTRFWIEVTLAGTSAIFFLLTILWKDWVEVIFGVDPDHGDGSVEWQITVAAAVLAVLCAVLARIEWQRMRPLTAD